MRRQTLFLIVPEGWLVLCVLALAFAVINALVSIWVACPFLVLIIFSVFFFRDTPRSVPAEPMAVVAPVDGTVIHRREGYDPYLDREAVKLTIRVNPFGAYLLRSPVEGTVVELSDDVIDRLGGVASMIRTDEGDALVMAIRHGSLLGERPCRSGYGDRVGQGRCCGRRRLARRVELFLPVNSRVEVDLGSHVRAGTCVLAKLVHKQKTDGSGARSASDARLSGAA